MRSLYASPKRHLERHPLCTNVDILAGLRQATIEKDAASRGLSAS